jgi:hypothetical protein
MNSKALAKMIRLGVVMKIRALFGLSIVVVFMLSMVFAVSAATPVARGKPGGSTGGSGIGSAGPASKLVLTVLSRSMLFVSVYLTTRVPRLAICPTVMKMPLTGQITSKAKVTP